MGAENWLPSKRSGLFDWEGFYVDYVGIYGPRYLERVCDEGEIDTFINYVVYEMNKRFPKLKVCDRCRGNAEDIYLEHEMLKLVMGENETSVAVYMIMEDPELVVDYYNLDEDEEIDTDAYGEIFGEYVEGLKEILIQGYEGYVYERTGPWSSSRIG